MSRDREWGIKVWFLIGAGMILLYWLARWSIHWRFTDP